MAYCLSVDQDFPVCAPERRLYTLVYGEKREPLKNFAIERKIRGAHDQWIENTFEAYLGFDEALHLFFSKEFAQHVYSQLSNIAVQERRGKRRNTNESISCAKFSILRKIYDDFNDDLHPKDFTILETGMKLRANMVRPVSNYLPPDSTDLIISGAFEF